MTYLDDFCHLFAFLLLCAQNLRDETLLFLFFHLISFNKDEEAEAPIS
jgi:hypothetical protein